MSLAVIQTYLRKFHLPNYTSHVRPPFTTSPIPLSPFDPPVPVSGVTVEGVVYQPRETAVLDLFIVALIRERAEAMESELYETMNWREDVFTLYQVSRLSLCSSKSDRLEERSTCANSVTSALSLTLSAQTRQPQARLLDLLLAQQPPIPLPFPVSSLFLRFTSRKITLYRTVQVPDGGGTRKCELVAFLRERGETEETSISRMREGLTSLHPVAEGWETSKIL